MFSVLHQKIINWWENRKTYYRSKYSLMDDMFDKLSRAERFISFGTSFIIGMIIFAGLIVFMFQQADAGGKRDAHNFITRNIMHVTLTISEPLAGYSSTVLPTTVRVGTDLLYSYTDMYFLTHNDGRYFLFDNIDPVTCSPAHVYVVKEEYLRSIQYVAARPLAASCQPTLAPTLLATPPMAPSTPMPQPTPPTLTPSAQVTATP